MFTWGCSIQGGPVGIPQPRYPIHFSEEKCCPWLSPRA